MSDARGASWGPDMRDHTHWLGPRPEMIAGERLELGDALERGPDGRAYRYRDRSRPPAAGAYASAEAGGKVPISPRPGLGDVVRVGGEPAGFDLGGGVAWVKGGFAAPAEGMPDVYARPAPAPPEADPPGETWRDRRGLL